MADEHYTIQAGDVFGLWVILDPTPVTRKGKKLYLCRCSCDRNTERLVYSYALRTGAATHCGCEKAIKIDPTKVYTCTKCGTQQLGTEFTFKKTVCDTCTRKRKQAYNSRYWTENKEQLSVYHTKYMKEYEEKNKDKIAAQHKKYYEEHKDRIKLAHKQRYSKNRDTILAKRRARWHEKDKHKPEVQERRRVYNIKYKMKNKEKARIQSQIRWANNKKKYVENYRVYANNRRKIDPGFRARCNLASRFSVFIKNTKITYSKSALIGCTREELMVYLESKFKPGMTWDNYGRFGWHIDHIKPLSLFDLTCEEEAKIAGHYTNLQPLWAEENLRKSNTYIGE